MQVGVFLPAHFEDENIPVCAWSGHQGWPKYEVESKVGDALSRVSNVTIASSPRSRTKPGSQINWILQ